MVRCFERMLCSYNEHRTQRWLMWVLVWGYGGTCWQVQEVSANLISNLFADPAGEAVAAVVLEGDGVGRVLRAMDECLSSAVVQVPLPAPTLSPPLSQLPRTGPRSSLLTCLSSRVCPSANRAVRSCVLLCVLIP